jgi:hypothetical protein
MNVSIARRSFDFDQDQTRLAQPTKSAGWKGDRPIDVSPTGG